MDNVPLSVGDPSRTGQSSVRPWSLTRGRVCVHYHDDGWMDGS